MAINYTNRRRQKYYLHLGKTKNDKPRYYFSMKADDAPLAESVPPGFEIYENPNGQVFLRRVQRKLISDDELAMVNQELRRIARFEGSRVERKLRVLTVYLADRKEDLIKEFRRVIPWGPLSKWIMRRQISGHTMRSFNSYSLTTESDGFRPGVTATSAVSMIGSTLASLVPSPH